MAKYSQDELKRMARAVTAAENEGETARANALFVALANAMGITPRELARRFDELAAS